MPKYHSTTQADFEIFSKSMYKYVDLFGLKSWEVSVSHNDKHIDNRATCEADLSARHATITLTKSKWGYVPSEREIKLVAFHEVCELLLWSLVQYAEARKPEGDIQSITHEIIHTLENSLFVLVEDRLNCDAKSKNLTTSAEQ